MDKFEHGDFYSKIIKQVLLSEGNDKITNDPADRGGLTRFGVADAADGIKDGMTDVNGDGKADKKIIDLTEADAIQIFKREYYDPIHAEYFKSKELILNIFDFGVNAGIVQAVKTLQKALGITEDGVVGPNTAKTANNYPGNIVGAYKSARKDFYDYITKRSVDKYLSTHPNATEKDLMTYTNKRFIKGWKNRVDNLKLGES